MSAAVSAKRTCSRPHRISTIRLSGDTPVFVIESDDAIGGRCCRSAEAPPITRRNPRRPKQSAATASPDIRTSADQQNASFRIGPRCLVPGHGIQLEPMPDQFITEFIGNHPLQPLNLLIAELDHTTGLQVNQMVMMGTRHFFIARTPIAKIVPSENAGLFE